MVTNWQIIGNVVDVKVEPPVEFQDVELKCSNCQMNIIYSAYVVSWRSRCVFFMAVRWKDFIQ